VRSRRKKGRIVDGIIVLDKAKGLSSNYALQNVKKLFEAKKAGHTGSLDPLATGVLPLCFGEATKLSQFLLNSDKGYVAQIKLGQRTDTGDSEGNIIETVERLSVGATDIEQALRNFKGDIQQVPPMFSALKKNGVPLYKYARKGISVERSPRSVTIYAIDLLSFKANVVELDIACSKGTYIRSIADDLGRELGCGAHLVGLRRTKAGVFTLQDSLKEDYLHKTKATQGIEALDNLLAPMDRAILELPEITLLRSSANCVKNGQAVILDGFEEEGLVRLYEEGQFIGIGRIDGDGKVVPKRLIVSQ
jgi:tRNA pseudouridine55 synthase